VRDRSESCSLTNLKQAFQVALCVISQRGGQGGTTGGGHPLCARGQLHPSHQSCFAGCRKCTHLSSSSCCLSWTRRSSWAPGQPEPGRSLRARSGGPRYPLHPLSCLRSGLAWAAVVGVCWTGRPAGLHRRAACSGSCQSERSVSAASPAVEKRRKSHWAAR